jgi:hypothetical protein
MNFPKLMLISVLSVMMLAACAKKETPAETQKDVAEATADGAQSVASERRDAAAVATDAQASVVDANANVDLERAKADYKIAIEKCDADTGMTKDACKSAARAALDAAQAQIDARKP